jgi:hypothetical protein
MVLLSVQSPLTTVLLILCLLTAQPGRQSSLHDPEKWGSSCVLPSYWQQTLTALALQLPFERATPVQAPNPCHRQLAGTYLCNRAVLVCAVSAITLSGHAAKAQVCCPQTRCWPGSVQRLNSVIPNKSTLIHHQLLKHACNMRLPAWCRFRQAKPRENR